jgi:hypothetical protein
LLKVDLNFLQEKGYDLECACFEHQGKDHLVRMYEEFEYSFVDDSGYLRMYHLFSLERLSLIRLCQKLYVYLQVTRYSPLLE